MTSQKQSYTVLLAASIFLICCNQPPKIPAVEKEKVFQTPHFIAVYFELAGLKEEAFKWLEHAVSMGFINYPFLAEYDFIILNCFKTEDRFQKLLERVKTEWEQPEV